MPKLILVTASGLAREVLAVLRGHGEPTDVAVVDDAPSLWGGSLDGAPIIGGLECVGDHADRQILVCAGRGTSRRALVRRLSGLGVAPDRYARVVHPSVDVPDDCTLGRGSIVLAQVALTSRVRLGDHVVVMPNATLTHDDEVDDFATLCAGVTLGGNVHVRSGAYLGMNASVREGTSVGEDSVLGMGAALVTDLPSRQVWAGVPAAALNDHILEVS